MKQYKCGCLSTSKQWWKHTDFPWEEVLESRRWYRGKPVLCIHQTPGIMGHAIGFLSTISKCTQAYVRWALRYSVSKPIRALWITTSALNWAHNSGVVEPGLEALGFFIYYLWYLWYHLLCPGVLFELSSVHHSCEENGSSRDEYPIMSSCRANYLRVLWLSLDH